MAETYAAYDGETDLKPTIDFVMMNRRFLLICLALGTLAGFLLASFVPPVYQVTGIIQIGKVAGNVIEAPLVVIARFKLKTFQQDVIQSSGLSEQSSESSCLLFCTDAQWIAKSLDTAQVLENTDYVTLDIKAHSISNASYAFDAVLSTLIKREDALTQALLNKPQKEKQDTESYLKTAIDERNEMENQLLQSKKLDSSQAFAQSVLYASLLNNKNTEIQGYRNQLLTYEEQLNPTQTSRALLAERLYVQKDPIYPNKTTFTLMGLLLGFMVGAGLIVARKSCAKSS